MRQLCTHTHTHALLLLLLKPRVAAAAAAAGALKYASNAHIFHIHVTHASLRFFEAAAHFSRTRSTGRVCVCARASDNLPPLKRAFTFRRGYRYAQETYTSSMYSSRLKRGRICTCIYKRRELGEIKSGKKPSIPARDRPRELREFA